MANINAWLMNQCANGANGAVPARDTSEGREIVRCVDSTSDALGVLESSVDSLSTRLGSVMHAAEPSASSAAPDPSADGDSALGKALINQRRRVQAAADSILEILRRLEL